MMGFKGLVDIDILATCNHTLVEVFLADATGCELVERAQKYDPLVATYAIVTHLTQILCESYSFISYNRNTGSVK